MHIFEGGEVQFRPGFLADVAENTRTFFAGVCAHAEIRRCNGSTFFWEGAAASVRRSKDAAGGRGGRDPSLNETCLEALPSCTKRAERLGLPCALNTSLSREVQNKRLDPTRAEDEWRRHGRSVSKAPVPHVADFMWFANTALTETG